MASKPWAGPADGCTASTSGRGRTAGPKLVLDEDAPAGPWTWTWTSTGDRGLSGSNAQPRSRATRSRGSPRACVQPDHLDLARRQAGIEVGGASARRRSPARRAPRPAGRPAGSRRRRARSASAPRPTLRGRQPRRRPPPSRRRAAPPPRHSPCPRCPLLRLPASARAATYADDTSAASSACRQGRRVR